MIDVPKEGGGTTFLWPTSGSPNTLERINLQVANEWAWCLVGGSPTLQSGGPNQKMPTIGPRDYMTPIA